MADRTYRPAFVQRVERANPFLIGVKLGQTCIKLGIPIKDVAEYLGVNRTNLYSWMRGRTKVPANKVQQIEELINKLK